MEATQVIVQEEALKGREELPLKPPRQKKKWLKWALIALAAVAVIWFIVLRPRGTEAAGAGLFTAEAAGARDLRVTVKGSGAVTPIESYRVSALASGTILDAPFEVGDRIEAGQVLYQIDPSDAQTAIQQAELALRQARLTYDDLRAGLKPAAGAAGVVREVHVQKGDLVSPGTPIADISDSTAMTVELPFHSADAARLAVGQRAQVTVSGTMEVLEGTVKSIASADLVGAGGALVRQVSIRVDNPGALTAGSAATAQVGDVACAAAGSFRENSRHTVVAQTSGQVTELYVTAGSRVSAGTALAAVGGDAAESALANASIGVENAQLSLRRAQDALENYTITAPISGTVIEKNFKAGDKVNGMEGGPLAILYDMSSLKLPISVSELDLNRVREGQRVEITAEALPGQVFEGVVDRVSINGTTTNGFTTYPVTILLERFGDLNPGMNVSADLIVEEVGGVLCVPVAAVNSDGTVLVAGPGAMAEDGVTVADPLKAESRPVELGRSADGYIEVLSGLEEGEMVLLPVQAVGTPGAGGAGMAVTVAGG